MKFNDLIVPLAVSVLVSSPGIHGAEQLEQETISIRGNRALPKTLYIAPWKRLGAPLSGEDLESMVSEKVDPVEQELFRREIDLHREGYILD